MSKTVIKTSTRSRIPARPLKLDPVMSWVPLRLLRLLVLAVVVFWIGYSIPDMWTKGLEYEHQRLEHWRATHVRD
jgi:hypothetical protein